MNTGNERPAAGQGELSAAPRWLWAGVVCSAALWIAAVPARAGMLWGIDSLRFLPIALAIVLALCALSGLIPAVSKRLGAALERLANAYSRHGLTADVLVSAVVAVKLFAIRDPIRFVGDSDLRFGLISSRLDAGKLFPQAFPLDVFMNAHLPRALISAGMTPAGAIGLVGALMGAVFAWLGLNLAKAIGARGVAIPAIFCVWFGGGTFFVFQGYDKFGPLLIGLAIAALGAVRMSRSGRGAWLLALGTSITILTHRTGYAILPAAAWVFVLAYRGALDGAERRRLLAPFGVAVAVALAMLPKTVDLLMHFDVGIQQGVSAQDPGGLWRRPFDTVNALLWFVPTLACIVALGIAAMRQGPVRAKDRSRFSLLAPVLILMGAELLVSLATRAQQGAARDWDINSGLGLAVMLCAAGAITRVSRAFETRSLLSAMLVIQLAATTSLVWVTANERPQLRRIEALVNGWPQWAPEERARSFDFAGWHAFNAGAFAEAGQWFKRAAGVEPNPSYYYEAGLAFWRAKNMAAARENELTAIRLAPTKGDPWWILAAIARSEGDSARVSAMIDSARVRGSGRPPAGL